MKRKYFNGKLGLTTTIRIGCTAAICMLPAKALAGGTEAPAAPAAAAEPEPASNWVEFTVGGIAVNGDNGAFKHRTGTNGDFYGGISSMHWEQEANDITWTLDGHALFGNDDYKIVLGAEKADLGYVEAGFSLFRTWYDATGGYIPGNVDGWLPLLGDDLAVYRGEAWLEAGLRMEDLPEVTFRYTHSWRDGEKDSTSWGRLLGASSGYGIVPSLNEIDETKDTFELDVTHTVGNTDLGLGLRYEAASNDNYRYLSSTESNPSRNAIVTQRDVYDSDLFNANTFSTTRFNERMMLSFGYSFTTMDTDTDGSYRDTVPKPVGRHDNTPILGGAEFKSHVANASFWWNPIDDLTLVPSIRAEWTDESAIAYGFDEPGEALSNITDMSDSEYNALTEQLDIRYSGLENILLYSRLTFTQAERDIDYEYIEQDTPDMTFEEGFRIKNSDINQEKYLVGANWYPLSCLSFSTQYYHRHSETEADNELDGTDAHLGNLDITTDDFSLRMTWRALNNLTLVSRYDYQQTSIDAQGIDGTDARLPFIQSADITSHIFSQGVTWLPFENAFVQGTVSWVFAETDTPADEQAPKRITQSENDYITANLTVGYALSQKTDITAGYSYYYADNYDVPYNGATPGSVGFGTDMEEHIFNVRLNHQINPNMIWNLGYAYYTSNDGTSGGNNDYDAHMVSTGLQIRF